MAEYIVRIIGYGLLLFVNGMIYYFLHSQFYFLVLVLMVAGPILSAMSVWVLRHYLQVEIHHAQDSYGVQGRLRILRYRSKIQRGLSRWIRS